MKYADPSPNEANTSQVHHYHRSPSPHGSQRLRSSGELIKRKTCTLTWHGSHSYGGGGPGQEPIDNLAFSLEVVGGGKHYSAVKDPNGPNNSFSYTVGTAGWGSLHEIKTGASYNGAGSTWYSCGLTKQGVHWEGTVKKSVIHSGTVSVTDDDCFVDFPCAE